MRFLTLSLKYAFLLFSVCGSFFTKAGDISDQLKHLTEKWDALTCDSKTFQKRYADLGTLLWETPKRGSYCMGRKTKFLNEDFSQQIVSLITVQFYSFGAAKCSFTKEVRYKQVVKTHPCYLLFKQEF